MSDPNEIVAVKVAGKFAEFYSPSYKDPYEDNEQYRDFYNEKVLPIQPVLGPSLGDSENQYLTGDLTCLAERLACDCEGSDTTEGWVENRDTIMDYVDKVFEEGKAISPVVGNLQLIITPLRRGELPPINEEHLKVYGKYADLIRERVAAI